MKSQHEKIINVMETDPDRWWLPHEFIQPDLGSNFVGYEASARLSELAKMGKVESRREGKYMARRLIQVTPVIKKTAPAPKKPNNEPDTLTMFDIEPTKKRLDIA